jgi:hypothetical protein
MRSDFGRMAVGAGYCWTLSKEARFHGQQIAFRSNFAPMPGRLSTPAPNLRKAARTFDPQCRIARSFIAV